MNYYKLILFFVSLFLLFVFFKDVGRGEFLFLHDEFLISNRQEAEKLFFVRDPVDLGTANTTVLNVNFFDRAYYVLFYNLGFSLAFAQRFLYFFKLLFLTFLPFAGFKKLSDIFLGKKNDLAVLFVSLWYSFNTFTLVYWHGNGFSLTMLLCYALSPLAFYFFHKAVFEEEKGAILKTAALFFLMSFSLYFFAVFCLAMLFYAIFYWWFVKASFFKTVKNIFLLVAALLPFLVAHSLVFYDLFINISKTINLSGGETYGLLQGGFLYPLFMWFSWAIYNYWEPRNIYSFYQYFKTLPYLISTFLIYAMILLPLFKKDKEPSPVLRKNKAALIIFLFAFLFFLFFIKGAQPPFGEAYLFLLKNFPPFRMFRSPDTKFSFGIVFSLAVLLLLVSGKHKKWFFPPILALVILGQSFLLFSGAAIKGQNIPGNGSNVSSQRIISVSPEYKEAINFLNDNSFPYGYALSFPSVSFGHFKIYSGTKESHIGQDLISKLSRVPQIYLSIYSGMFSGAYERLSSLNLTSLEEFPIRYIIFRKDIDPVVYANDYASLGENFEQKLGKDFELSFKNQSFSIFENKFFSPLINSPDISFEIINPVKYKIVFHNVKETQDLSFLQSFHSDWKLYPATYGQGNACQQYFSHKVSGVGECKGGGDLFSAEDLGYMFRASVFDASHNVFEGYANSWKISPEEIKSLGVKYFKQNPDGSVDFELTLFFRTQSLFYLSMIFSFSYFFIALFLIARRKIKHAEIS